MQLFEHTMAILRDTNNITTIPASSHIEMKEKRSSNASLMMNPVASGDNMALDINLAQKIEELPPLVPCCEGRELQINEEIVRSGLSAISVKHDSVIHCMSMSCACERMQVPPGLVKHRNSFRSLHRPDLKRVPYLRRMTPDELETLFRGYAEFHLKTSLKIRNDPKEDVTQTLPPDEKLKKEVKEAPTIGQNDVVHSSVARRGAEDVPAGKRLHGARARLYTSVLASATPGDQLDNASAPDEYDSTVPDEPLPEDDIILNEELQIILPPRPDDVTADPSLTASMQNQ
ncbi:uncharacterized protein LOC123705648 isoform X2 [Colias croceus]|uniref:uncharacterized protein LOC123705648 isoform X2 n=1 Tax=Colias crocea TaxID=72248 RepID=UPI001E280901|nr:uncharacterized protein LOC123705648 isoform X2 [Colias croceus]